MHEDEDFSRTLSAAEEVASDTVSTGRKQVSFYLRPLFRLAYDLPTVSHDHVTGGDHHGTCLPSNLVYPRHVAVGVATLQGSPVCTPQVPS